MLFAAETTPTCTVDGCEGIAGQRDSVVLCFDDDVPVERLLALFPGDIQNHRALMRGMSGANAFAAFSFEDVAGRLHARCAPGTAVAVVCPPRHSGSLALWEHFLRGGCTAAHVQRLLADAVRRATAARGMRLAEGATAGALPLVLCGFSKGSLVLNGIASDVATLKTGSRLVLDWEDPDKAWTLPPYEPSMRIAHEGAGADETVRALAGDVNALLARLRAVHWVDAHRFPTAPAVVGAFAAELGARRVRVFLHGSPRQLRDRGRRWIACEHDAFLALLPPQQVTDAKYFWDESGTLENHFAVLDAFPISDA